MYKSLTTIAMLGVLVLSPATAGAASITLAPGTLSGETGDTVALNISVDPDAGETAYTAKIELHYPSDVLDFTSFVPSSGWQMLEQGEYDVVDEENGVIVKTAGLPGGFSDARSFGTLTFTGAQTGSGVVEAVDATVIFDAVNNDIAEGLPTTASVEITETPTAPASPTTQDQPRGGQQQGPPAQAQSDEASETGEEARKDALAATGTQDQTAAVGNIFTKAPWLTFFAALFALTTIFFAYLWWRSRRV